MAFKYHKSLQGAGAPALVRVIIDNSDTITLGDMVRVYNAGDAEVAAAGKPIFGVVHAVVNKAGQRPTPDSGTTDTWTVAADNETVAQLAVLVDPSPLSIYSGAQDGTVGTTNSSQKPGAAFDLADEATISETSAVRTGQAQLYGHGVDPNASTRILVSILESEMRAGGAY